MKARFKRHVLPVLLVALLLFAPQTIQAKTTYYSTWTEYTEANNITTFTYNDVVDAMEDVMDAAVSAYKSGDSERALSIISDAKNNY